MNQSQVFYLLFKKNLNINLMNSFKVNDSEYRAGQDSIVDIFLKSKTNGFFLDVGAYNYMSISNTFFLEKQRAWSGVAVEIDSSFNEGWKSNRKNTHYINQDALTVDYKSVLEACNAPKTIDYLSVDLEPPEVTLKALYKVFESNFNFNIISFEVDWYRDLQVKDKSRDFLSNNNYTLVAELIGGQKPNLIHVDDLWVNNDYIHNIL
jgi:hypothetical protein